MFPRRCRYTKARHSARRPVSPMAKERHPESAAAEATKPKTPVTYQVAEQPSTRVQEEEFAKHCGLRATWPRPVCRRRGHWSRFASQESLKGSDPLQRRGLKPRRERWPKNLRRKNWRKKGGVRVGRVTSCHLPVRNEAKSNGVRLGVRSTVSRWLNRPDCFCYRESDLTLVGNGLSQALRVFLKKISLIYPV